jgi:hypothetical protein
MLSLFIYKSTYSPIFDLLCSIQRFFVVEALHGTVLAIPRATYNIQEDILICYGIARQVLRMVWSSLVQHSPHYVRQGARVSKAAMGHV